LQEEDRMKIDDNLRPMKKTSRRKEKRKGFVEAAEDRKNTSVSKGPSGGKGLITQAEDEEVPLWAKHCLGN